MRNRLVFIFTLAALIPLPLAGSAQGQFVRQVPVVGTTVISNSSFATDTGQGPELDPALTGDDENSPSPGPPQKVNRTIAKSTGNPLHSTGHEKAKSNPELLLSIDGLNHFDTRFSNEGNQFSTEPPDQGLCVGNGFVLETVNSVLSVYDTSGNLLAGPEALNSFYGYLPAINRTTGAFGPDIADPSCHFDAQTQRWFHLVITLDRVGTTSTLAGSNHLDLAVSDTPSPLGSWHFYHIPVQDDGTDGTPNHNCGGPPQPPAVTNPNACFGDYPHLGADANGFYITTNEFPLFANGFVGAQIYAMSKTALAAGAAVTVVQFDTSDPSLGVQLDGNPGFTVWPALSTGNQFEGAHGGTEFFLSSEAVFQDSGVDSRLRLWSLSNTKSLNGNSPALSLSADVLNTIPYAVPPRSTQKIGDIPLATCLSDSSLQVSITPPLFGCWRLVLAPPPSGPFPNSEKQIESNDSRMQQVALANGKLWAALDTGLLIDGDPTPRAGVAFFTINPNSKKVSQQGYAGLAQNNLTYPAIAVTQSGRGVMAFTVVGDDFYPSAGYAGIDDKIGVGDLHVAAEGQGPDDGFTGYHPFSVFSSRPRWGDYGAAATDGNSIWIGSEYINQTCTFSTWLGTSFRCGNTRTQLANWGTRLSLIAP